MGNLSIIKWISISHINQCKMKIFLIICFIIWVIYLIMNNNDSENNTSPSMWQCSFEAPAGRKVITGVFIKICAIRNMQSVFCLTFISIVKSQTQAFFSWGAQRFLPHFTFSPKAFWLSHIAAHLQLIFKCRYYFRLRKSCNFPSSPRHIKNYF